MQYELIKIDQKELERLENKERENEIN